MRHLGGISLARRSGNWPSANGKLYTCAGLETARKALKPNGLLVVCSAAPDRAFAARLGHAGFAVEEITARAHKGRGGRYVIWVGKKAR